MNPTEVRFPPMLRVSSEAPCLVCGHPDWCMISPRSDYCICCRKESRTRIDPFDGWLHYIPVIRRHVYSKLDSLKKHVQGPVQDFGPRFPELFGGLSQQVAEIVGRALGLDPSALLKFPLGYQANPEALIIPAMGGIPPRIVGIRYRRLRPSVSLKWWAEPGSTTGVLLPTQVTPAEVLVVTEGPSDCLATTQVGLAAVGRWSCGLDGFQAQTISGFATTAGARRIVVYGDNDENGVGERGARATAALLREVLPATEVWHSQPPPQFKDLRDWIVRGAAAPAILSAERKVQS